MTGTEDTAFEIVAERMVEAYVDLSAMHAGDSLMVRQYMKIAAEGDYIKYGEVPYDDLQNIPLLWITPKPGMYGVKLTIQQTAGVNRAFPYAVFSLNRR